MNNLQDHVYVYIIINEWPADGGDGDSTLQEIVNNRFFASENEAFFHLKAIAEAHQIILEDWHSSFTAPFENGTQEYHIEELWNG